jgi:Cu-Zn family superoxide dismutase
MQNQDGDSLGTVMLTQTPYGALLHAKLNDLSPGAHAFHVHAVGECEPPFKSAGGHYNPVGSSHGFMDPDGMHYGDLPNIHVPENGELEFEVLAPRVNLDAMLFDADGASIVIHAGPDDYQSEPAGAAGPRIACGVIQPL